MIDESLEEGTEGASKLERLGTLGMEELSTEQNQWIVTLKAGPASLFHVVLQFALTVVKSIRDLRLTVTSTGIC